MSRKYLYLFVFFSLLLLGNGYGQGITRATIIGIWQVSSPKISSSLLAHYQFFNDGKFIYTLNSYDDRGRIINAEGVYELIGDKLLLYIKFRTERTGGDLVQGGMGFQQEEIILGGTKLVKVLQKSQEPIELIIEACKMKSSVKCIKLQNNVYYQISKNPVVEL